MKRSAISLVLGLAHIVTAQQMLEPDTQSGDFLFKMPAGWKQVQSGKIAMLLGPTTKPGAQTSITLMTAGIDTNLRASFDKAWQTLVKPYQIQQSGQLVSQRLPGGNEALARSAVATDQLGKQWAAIFVMAANGNRSELVLFTTDDLQPEAYRAAQTALTGFLRSLRFAGMEGFPDGIGGHAAGTGNPFPAQASGQSPSVGITTPPGRIAGLYRAMAHNGVNPAAGLDLFDPAKKTADYAFLTFFPDGHVKKGLILMGFDSYVVDSSFRHDVANGGAIAAKWGQYQIAGGQGRIIFASGALAGQQLIYGLRGEIWGFTQYPDRLQVQGDTYYLLDSGNGLRLEGFYKPFGDITQPGIRFTRDGQFVDEGILDSKTSTAVGLAGGGVGIAYGFSSPHAGRGTYSINNYGLQLNYANGQMPNSVFFIELGSSRDNVQVLYINNVKYQRVQ